MSLGQTSRQVGYLQRRRIAAVPLEGICRHILRQSSEEQKNVLDLTARYAAAALAPTVLQAWLEYGFEIGP